MTSELRKIARGAPSGAEIRAAAKEQATRMRRLLAHDSSDGPLSLRDLKLIARNRAIVEYEFDAPLAAEGALLPLWTGGFSLRVARRPNTARARFTIAHEVGHTFFYDIAAAPPRRLFDHDSTAQRRSAHDVIPAEERFCDEFASQLLLPADAAGHAFGGLLGVAKGGELLRGVEELSQVWGVSVLTVFGRLAELEYLPASMIVVVLRRRVHAKLRTDPDVRVVGFYPRPTREWYVPYNQRAVTVGLEGGVRLFDWWYQFPGREPGRRYRRAVVADIEAAGGELRVRENQAPAATACEERLRVWRKAGPNEPWQQGFLTCMVSYRFYGVNVSEAYCVALIDTCGTQVHAWQVVPGRRGAGNEAQRAGWE